METSAIQIMVKDDSEQALLGNQLIQKATAFMIVDDQAADEGNELCKALKERLDFAEEYHAPEIEAAHELHKNLCAKRNAMANPLKLAYKALADRIAVYLDNQRKKREEEERKRIEEARKKEEAEKEKLIDKAVKAEEAGDNEKAEELLQKAEDHYVAPKPVASFIQPKGAILSYEVSVTVTDKNKIPEMYKMIDEMMLRKAYKTSKYQLFVPGVIFNKRPIGSVRG